MGTITKVKKTTFLSDLLDVPKLLKLEFEKKLGPISGAVILGKTAQTYEQWNKLGYWVNGGQLGTHIVCGEVTGLYFWWSQVNKVKNRGNKSFVKGHYRKKGA